MCSANDYRCANESVHRQKAQGTFFSSWESVQNNKIQHAYGRSLLAISDNDIELYYKQTLLDEAKLNNYTAISKIDGEYNQQWQVVYQTALDLNESIVIDDLGFLYTIFNVRDNENNH